MGFGEIEEGWVYQGRTGRPRQVLKLYRGKRGEAMVQWAATAMEGGDMLQTSFAAWARKKLYKAPVE